MNLRPLASLGLRLSGWEYEGEPPREKKWVGLAVPHTSNWDGLMLILLAQKIGLDMKWMIKGDWVNGPLGALLRQTGAMAIDRSRSHNVVQQMIDEMKRRDQLALVIPPEGTRHLTEYWKSGFYHIALGAGVPVVPGYLDYARKRGGFGPPIHLTGHVKADMDRIRAFYAQRPPTPHRPEAFGEIRLREETPEATA